MSRLSTRLAVAACVAVCAAPALAAQQFTAIRAGRLLDVDKGEVRRDQVILVRGQRIESVQPRPPGFRRP